MKTIIEEQLTPEFIKAIDELNQTAHEPLFIELHGKKFAVVKEEENQDRRETDYQPSSQNSIRNLKEFFRNSPLYGAELDLERDKSPSRETEL